MPVAGSVSPARCEGTRLTVLALVEGVCVTRLESDGLAADLVDEERVLSALVELLDTAVCLLAVEWD